MDQGIISKFVFHNYRRKKNNRLERDARMLHLLVKGNLSEPTTVRDISIFEDILQANIIVVASEEDNAIVKPSKCVKNDRPFYAVYMTPSGRDDVTHHFHAIFDLPRALGHDFFCNACLKAHSLRNYHDCGNFCVKCKTARCREITGAEVRCEDCNIDFIGALLSLRLLLISPFHELPLRFNFSQFF